jgi:hypothetical protein
MNNTVTVEGLGKSDPIDTIRFDEADEATIDMTEIINYDKQLKVTKVVSGVESFISTGQLDAATALYLGVKAKPGSMDPLGSTYNTRFGGEGFFQSTLKALETGIVAVIRFIKKIVLWVVDKIKVVFGLKPSDRQAAAVKEKMPEIKQQLGAYLLAMGFPAHLVDLDKFLEDVPDGRFNKSIKYLSSKLVSKEHYLENFTQIPGLIQGVCATISKGVKKAKLAKKRFSDKLEYIVRKSKERNFNFDYEGGALREAMLEVIQSLNYKDITPQLSKLLEVVMQQTYTEDDFAKHSIEIAQKITASLITAQQSADVEFVRKIEQILAKTTVENFEKLDEQKNDLSEAMKDLFGFAGTEELTQVAMISNLSNDGRYLGFYQQMAGAVNVYTNFTKVTVEILRMAGTTFSDLGNWYSKANAFMLAAVANDVDTISKMMLAAQQKALKEGRPFTVDMYPNGVPKLVAVPEAEAQTFLEKAADVSSLVIENNLLNIRTAVNNFGKDVGMGKLL